MATTAPRQGRGEPRDQPPPAVTPATGGSTPSVQRTVSPPSTPRPGLGAPLTPPRAVPARPAAAAATNPPVQRRTTHSTETPAPAPTPSAPAPASASAQRAPGTPGTTGTSRTPRLGLGAPLTSPARPVQRQTPAGTANRPAGRPSPATAPNPPTPHTPPIPPGAYHQPPFTPATPPFLTEPPAPAPPLAPVQRHPATPPDSAPAHVPGVAPVSVQRHPATPSANTPAHVSDSAPRRTFPPTPVGTATAAAAPSLALPVQRATPAAGTSQPVPLRTTGTGATAPRRSTTPLPLAFLNPPTVQRDPLPTSLPPVLPPHSVKKTPVTGSTSTPTPTRPHAPLTKSETPPPPPPPPSSSPPDDPPPSYSASASASSGDDDPPAYMAIEEGGFDPRALTEYQVDALVHRIIDRITRQVRTELRRDRERVGKLRDFRP